MEYKHFKNLNSINVNEHIEKKITGGSALSYLSWPWAWAEAKSMYPDANYEIIKFNGLPYVFDEKTGYMVYTTITIEGITHEMWLPVMDGANKAMLDRPYKYKTRNGGEKSVDAATMFDINKTLMRCLVKNLAMFGLGLYIYAGEDLPESEQEQPQKAPASNVVKPAKANGNNAAKVSGGSDSDKAKLVADIKAAFKDADPDTKKKVKQIIMDSGAQTLTADLPIGALESIATLLKKD